MGSFLFWALIANLLVGVESLCDHIMDLVDTALVGTGLELGGVAPAGSVH